jgi:hypothetical protein
MRRRNAMGALGAALLGAATVCRALAAAPSYRVPLQQLQDMLAQRFPLRYPVPGLFDLSVDTPRLRVLPDLNRLAADLLVQAAGPALRRSHAGTAALDFGLRYEPSDQTIRAHHVRIESLRVEGLAGDAQVLMERALADLARQSMVEVVLHRLRPQDLALPDAMGLQPGAITVTGDGLVIGFVNKTAQ